VASELAYTGARRIEPALVLVAGAIVLGASGRWLARHGVLRAPVLRTRGVNLVATRGSATPRLWLCAHIDTKSQLVPTLIRSAGIVMATIGYVVALALSVAIAWGWAIHPVWWVFAALVTLAGAVPVMLSVTTFGSPGALDNASGVATVMLAASRTLDGELGVLITDAEELGLAGARAWSARTGGDAVILNCDGVDDHGRIFAMYSGKTPRALLDAIAAASSASGIAIETTRLVPGLLTDSVAFADAGIATVTFMRGTWRSLARVHSRRDDMTRLAGTGIAETATLMAHTLRVLGKGDTTR